MGVRMLPSSSINENFHADGKLHNEGRETQRKNALYIVETNSKSSEVQVSFFHQKVRKKD